MGDRPNRDISWFLSFADGGDPRDERLVDDEMIRLSKTRAESRCKAKHLRHIRDRMAQSGLCVCAGFAHPVVLLHQLERFGGRRLHLRVIDVPAGPQFWRHYREGAPKQTLGRLSPLPHYRMHLTFFYLPSHGSQALPNAEQYRTVSY